MSWKGLLEREIEDTYAVTDAMVALVEDASLDWKPATGENWMTTGQLLKHIATACGPAFQGFVTGDWGMPEGMSLDDLGPEDMLPPAEKMPSVDSVAATRKELADDKKLTLAFLGKLTEDELAHKPAPVPWDKKEMILGHRLLHMVQHLAIHKAQLFYYLKLQGKPVHTATLWGGAS